MSIRGRCPRCEARLTTEDLRVNPTVCPACKAELHVCLKANWAYTVVSLTVGVVIAYLQGHESIILALWALFYGMVILVAIKIYRWELHLPIKVVKKPDLSLFPRDAS